MNTLATDAKLFIKADWSTAGVRYNLALLAGFSPPAAFNLQPAMVQFKIHILLYSGLNLYSRQEENKSLPSL